MGSDHSLAKALAIVVAVAILSATLIAASYIASKGREAGSSTELRSFCTGYASPGSSSAQTSPSPSHVVVSCVFRIKLHYFMPIKRLELFINGVGAPVASMSLGGIRADEATIDLIVGPVGEMAGLTVLAGFIDHGDRVAYKIFYSNDTYRIGVNLSQFLRFQVLNVTGRGRVDVRIPKTQGHLYAFIAALQCRNLTIRLRSSNGDWIVKSVLGGDMSGSNFVSVALRTDKYSFDELVASCKGSGIRVHILRSVQAKLRIVYVDGKYEDYPVEMYPAEYTIAQTFPLP